LGTLKIEHKNAEGKGRKTIDLNQPWKRAKYKDSHPRKSPRTGSTNARRSRQRAHDMGAEIGKETRTLKSQTLCSPN
jgi:hypothetical protein